MIVFKLFFFVFSNIYQLKYCRKIDGRNLLKCDNRLTAKTKSFFGTIITSSRKVKQIEQVLKYKITSNFIFINKTEKNINKIFYIKQKCIQTKEWEKSAIILTRCDKGISYV